MGNRHRVNFLYKNHAGETAWRCADFDYVYFGTSQFHPDEKEQWFVKGYDHDRGYHRTYAVKDIQFGDPKSAK